MAERFAPSASSLLPHSLHLPDCLTPLYFLLHQPTNRPTSFLSELLPSPLLLNYTQQMVDAYHKIEKIGEGTYGVVYKAKDLETGDIGMFQLLALLDVSDRLAFSLLLFFFYYYWAVSTYTALLTLHSSRCTPSLPRTILQQSLSRKSAWKPRTRVSRPPLSVKSPS